MGIFSSIANGIGKAFGSFTNPIGTLVNAGTSLLGGAMSAAAQNNSSRWNYEAQKLANQGNLELAKYAYSANLDQWNRQNEYNSPAAQMKRFEEAGLNPNLIYSQGNSGNAASSPQFNPPTLQPASRRAVDYGQVIGNMIGQYNNLRLQQKEIELKNAQINNLESQASYNGVRESLGNQLIGFNNERNPLALNLLSQHINNQVITATNLAERAENLAAERQLLIAQRDSVLANTKKSRIEYRFLKSSFDSRLKAIDAQIRDTNARAFGQELRNKISKWDVGFLENQGFKFSSDPRSFFTNAIGGLWNNLGEWYRSTPLQQYVPW